ncbi:hypothetical protein PAMP_008553 [Pampus punctatissimus]
MCAVQLLRVSVHERISAAAEDFLLQVEKREKTAEIPLRALLTERLTAAAEEIVGLLEETVAEYEDRVERATAVGDPEQFKSAASSRLCRPETD